MSIFGFDAPGRLAFGQITEGSWQTSPSPQWQLPIRKTGLAVALLATTFAGFVAPPQARAAVFSKFGEARPARAVLPGEQPSALFETVPLAVPFAGFMDFGAPRFARYSFADQQASMLFEVEFVPPVQGGGTSRKLDAPESAAPRRGKKTGLEPIKKVAAQPLIEPRKPALPLPPFTSAQPAPLDQRSPLDVVDRELIPHGLQAQILAAQAAYLDEQDARDITDVMAILDDLDGDET